MTGDPETVSQGGIVSPTLETVPAGLPPSRISPVPAQAAISPAVTEPDWATPPLLAGPYWTDCAHSGAGMEEGQHAGGSTEPHCARALKKAVGLAVLVKQPVELNTATIPSE